MRLRPRQYVLILLILLIGAWNLFRIHRLRERAAANASPTPAITLAPAPPAQSATWSAFDKAAALRDAPDTTFQPALAALHAAPDANTSDVSGCITWLEFYRQGRLHPAVDPTWADRSTRHLKGCTQLHRDALAP